MYCTVCGKELAEGTKFCTGCGTAMGLAGDSGGVGAGSVPPADDSAPVFASVPATGAGMPSGVGEGSFGATPLTDPAWGQGPGVPADPKRSRRAKRIGLAAAMAGVLVVAAVGLGFWFFPDGLPFVSSSEEASCSSVTRIVPQNKTGEPLSSYLVRLTPLDVEGEVPELLPLYVEDEGGFTLEDFGDLPNGTYLPVVVDGNGEETAYAPLRKIDDSPAEEGAEEGDGQPVILVPQPNPLPAPEPSTEEGEAAAKQARARAYYAKCLEYQARFGESSRSDTSSIAVRNMDSSKIKATYHLEGLCFADLVDFDQDGSEELVLAYYNPEAAKNSSAPGSSQCYHSEVWTMASGSLMRVYDGGVFGYPSGPGEMSLVVGRDGLTCVEEGQAEPYDLAFYGMKDGSFSCVKRLAGEGEAWSVDGKAVDAQAWQDEYASIASTRNFYGLSYNELKNAGSVSSANGTAEGAVVKTEETLEKTLSTLAANAGFDRGVKRARADADAEATSPSKDASHKENKNETSSQAGLVPCVSSWVQQYEGVRYSGGVSANGQYPARVSFDGVEDLGVTTMSFLIRDDMVYYIDGSGGIFDGDICSTKLGSDGSDAQVLAQGMITDTRFYLSGDNIFFNGRITTGSDVTSGVVRVPLAGGEPALVPDMQWVFGATATDVFYVKESKDALYRCDADLGGETKLADMKANGTSKKFSDLYTTTDGHMFSYECGLLTVCDGEGALLFSKQVEGANPERVHFGLLTDGNVLRVIEDSSPGTYDVLTISLEDGSVINSTRLNYAGSYIPTLLFADDESVYFSAYASDMFTNSEGAICNMRACRQNLADGSIDEAGGWFVS